MVSVDLPKEIKSKFVHGFSTLDEGNMSSQFGPEDVVSANQNKFFSKIVPDQNPFTLAVIAIEHKDNITILKRPVRYSKSEFQSDAIITNETRVGLMVTPADCLPIFAFDQINNVLALIHAGWMGTDLYITKQTIQKMTEHFGTNPRDIIMIFGPSIHQKSYIYNTMLPAKNIADWSKYISKHPAIDGKYLVDNLQFNIDQAIDTGISQKNIYNIGLDTASDSRFFSHSRDFQNGVKDQGRLAAFGMLV